MERLKPQHARRVEKTKSSTKKKVPSVRTQNKVECLSEECATNSSKAGDVQSKDAVLDTAAINAELHEQHSTSLRNEKELCVKIQNSKGKVDHEGGCSSMLSGELEQSIAKITVGISATEVFDKNEGRSFTQDTLNTSNHGQMMPDNVAKEQGGRVSNKTDETHITFKEIVPFTENQLASLYNNPELVMVEIFISEFTETQLKSCTISQQHKLYDLLLNYLRVRNHLIVNSHELERLKRSCREIQKRLWCIDKVSITETGECQDGNPVVATHEYCTACFNHQSLNILSRKLCRIKETLHNTQALYCYEAEVLKLKIEHYIQRVCVSCTEFVNLSKNAPVSLLLTDTHSQTSPESIEIRTCITILFTFQRKLLKDGKFITDTREWLTRLIAILLRVATWQDHLFLLNHVLRCPGGVMSWARSFIQTPIPQRHIKLTVSSFDDSYLDHAIATLAVILLPIKDRDKFLEQVQKSLQDTACCPGDTVWVMLDEEGEEDEDIANAGAILLESDLISLLNQIPFTKVFQHVLCIEYKNNEYYQNKNYITYHHLLRMFAFFTTVVRILKRGLETYDCPRYRQFTKRLYLLIGDIMQYVNDQWEEYNKNQITDKTILIKLQLEFDYFFLRTVLCIFSSRGLGTCQYLASAPYYLLSPDALWQIFYVLHVDRAQVDTHISNRCANDWITELNSTHFRTKFEEKLSSMPTDECYFLLSTFANMAMARTDTDYEFVKTVTIDLFQIGFLSDKTQDSCSKHVRTLLSNLTDKHPSLISSILQKLKDNFESSGKLSLYLFTDLKLHKWKPCEEDIGTLSTWLHQYPLVSTQSELARLILARLNWGLDESNNLYLPIELHRHIALLIVELAMRYVPDSPAQTTSLLVESVKQVSSMIRQQNVEHAFSFWAWDMISKLRLHQLDQTDTHCQYVLQNPSAAFAHVPDMDSDSCLDTLIIGTREKQPIACYVATMMTLWGHSIPLICSNGFNQLEILLDYCKYDQVLICLHHIVPLFLECVDSLLKNDKFINVVLSLTTADRTYVKAAKRLIVSEFPGIVLKKFSNMIHSHLHNFKRYGLQNPKDFVYLWLNVLVLLPDWNNDQSILYLMDVVVGTAFFHTDAKVMVDDLFQNLFSNTCNSNVTSSFVSFLNWATGSSSSISLLGRSAQSVWVAYEVLLFEQWNREVTTGLWHELLKELSAQPKIPLDAALKRACATVKMPAFGANGLSIYRWSQQALDAPIDHPILPVLWQNFFALYLARVPSTSGIIGHGGIGERFFEGMINLSYLKKLKKRLQDTTAYFQLKGENNIENGQPITDCRRAFYFTLAKFYKTLSLWLEEPRLHEPGLYLPALPPQYMSQKLTLLVQNDRTPWLEYVDFWAVQQNQIIAVQEWKHMCCRNQSHHTEKDMPIVLPEMTLPLQRIYKRLNNYDNPASPPPINRNQTLFSNIYKEDVYNSTSVIGLVKPYLRTILDYAQTYSLMISEHVASDSTFLELVPTLYTEIEDQITLHALCDPAPSEKQSTLGAPPVVHCAGPAIITIKAAEAQINDDIDHMISQNRAEYENLLVKASQPPPGKIIQGCAFMDHLIAMLEHEIAVNRANGNVEAAHKVQESGIALFYYLIECYTEETSSYPPSKQLITTCLERLGHSFISGEENQGLELLNTIMQKPNLGGLLGPYFTPIAGDASKFLQMYQAVVEFSASTNIDLCFVLLSKFDIGIWLNKKCPRLSERSTFIDLVFKALCNMGLNPEEARLMLHGLFRNHLRLILLHDFPEHYGEVLNLMLRYSESQNLSLDIWQDFLGALKDKTASAYSDHTFKTDVDVRYYATEQRLLSPQEVYNTALLLSRHFMQERLQYGLYGLYPKYRIYNEPLSTFLSMIGHVLVVLTLQSAKGLLTDQVCEKIWPILCEMFSPWIASYWTRDLQEPTAAWIQQLTDDRSVLLPWIITDGPHANKIVAVFVNCIRFIIDTLPASNKIFSCIWQFYVDNFAHSSVKDHILNVIHDNLLKLPWDQFYPCVNDVEQMMKVVDQYLPDSHLFLGSVFTSVRWPFWINDLLRTQMPHTSAKMHICLLNLLVKLSTESTVKQSDKAVQLIVEAEKFSWDLLDATAYEHIINWYITNCDSRVVLSMDINECHPLDASVYNLLKIAAGYVFTASRFHPTTLKKRQLYIRSTTKLLANSATRYKSLLTASSKLFSNTLLKMLDDMEAIILNTVPVSQQITEANVLVTELLSTMNQSDLLMEHLRTTWTSWLLKRTACNPILMSVLKITGTVITSPSIVGDMMEAALEAYFTFNASEEICPTWASALIILQTVPPRQLPLESSLISDGKLLALYFFLLKRLALCQNIREEGVLLINLVDWLSTIRPANINEEKLPLLWAKVCELAYRQCQYNENTKIAVKALKSLANTLLTIADDGGQGWGILGAIGFRKGSHLSTRCRFLCRSIGVYCLAQLPESKTEQQLVRYMSHAPGIASSRSTDQDVTETRPSVDAIKAMQTLEGLLINKLYVELKADIERSIKLIKDPANSLHNAKMIIGVLTTELYNQRYLHVLID